MTFGRIVLFFFKLQLNTADGKTTDLETKIKLASNAAHGEESQMQVS